MKRAVVIVPTYNERDNIDRLLETLTKVFTKIKNWDMHILVVDDTSPDKTYELVTAAAKKNSHIHLLLNKQKAGLGGAYLKGMAKAFGDLQADVVFEFDADLSHDATQIPTFLQAIDDGADMVLGSRYVKGGGIPSNWGLHRKFLSVVGNIVIMTVLTDFRIRDWTTGFRAITKPVYEKVAQDLHSQRFSGYTFQIGFLHQAVRNGFAIKEVPFVFVDRTHGHSKLGPEYLKNTLAYIFKVRVQEILNNRIFKFATVGAIGAFVQLSTLQLYRFLLPAQGVSVLSNFQVATILSVATAILSNFILSNIWTFSDRKLKSSQIPAKLLQFYAASSGSLVIQFVISSLAERFIGLFTLFVWPFPRIVVDTGLVYGVVGILVGMFWNFFAYSRIIWRGTKPKV